MKIARRIAKILAWFVGSIIALVLLVLILIQVPAVQNFIRGKAVAWLQTKIGTKVEVRRLSIEFPKKVVLEGVYFEDQRKDTLLAGERLAVDISMLKLLKSEVEVNTVELKGIRANIYRIGKDTAFNYDYIVKAFVTEQKSPEPKDTTGSTMKFDVGKVQLDNIVATFRDDQSGNDVYFALGHFETRLKEFNIDTFAFDIPRIEISNIVARIRQYKPLMEQKPEAVREAESNEPFQMSLKLGTLDLKKIDFDYDNSISALKARLNLGELVAEADTIDLAKLFINLTSIKLSNTQAQITMGATEQAKVVEVETEKEVAAQANNPWKFVVDKMNINGVDFKFDNNNQPKAPKGMDYGHMDVQGLVFDANNLAFTPTTYQGQINKMAVAEKNAGFNLKELHTGFLYTDTGVVLNDFLLQTDRTVIRDHIAAAWPSLDTLSKDIGAMRLDLNIANSRISGKDVLMFAPTLATTPPFQKMPDAEFGVAINARGSVRDLLINNFEVNGLRATALKMNGTIKGLPDMNRAYLNLNLVNLTTNKLDLNALLPPNTVPNTVRIPEMIGVNGKFTGRLAEFTTQMNVRTTRGTANVTAFLKNNGAAYAVNAKATNLDVGYITMQEKTVGKISASIQARGSGFDPNTAVSDFRVNVFSAYAMGYDYRNLNLNGKLNKGNAVVKGDMHDPNLTFDLDAAANLKGKTPSAKLKLNLDSANFEALKLSTTPLRAHLAVDADFPVLDPNNPIGTLLVSDAVIVSGTNRITADTLSVAAYNSDSDSGYVLNIGSEVIAAKMYGRYRLTEIAPAVQSTIQKYYQLPGYQKAPFTSQDWTLDATVIPSPILLALAPQMKGTRPINATVKFNSDASDLNLLAQAPKIVFGTNEIDSLNIRANTADALNYAVTLEGGGNPSFRLYNTALTGNVANNQVFFALNTRDQRNTPKYVLAGNVAQTEDDGIRASLSPDSLILDYDRWSMAQNNYIQYSPAGIIAEDFTLSNGPQSLSIYSTTPSTTAPLNVKFTDFRIATLTDFAEQDSLLVDGLINGNAAVTNPLGTPVFTSDLALQNISYKKDTIGNVRVKVDNQTENALNADVAVDGSGNDIRLNGLYYISDQRLNMKLTLGNLNFRILPPLSAGQIQDAGGGMSGAIDIGGTVTAPQLNGNLKFDSAFITPTLLGERFGITADKLAFTPQGVQISRLALSDSANNRAVINGNVYTEDWRDYRFDMSFRARDFQAVNSKRIPGSDQLFFGRLNLTANATVKGGMASPVVNGSIRINPKTDLNILIPSNDPEVVDRIGVVRFVDKDHPGDSSKLLVVSDTVNGQTQVQGMDISARIETDSNAKFAVLIDENTGDALRIRGNSNLNFGLDPSGKTTLTGDYIVREGSYGLTLSLLKRQFQIQRGSTITWTGEPTTANVDITAVYVANTASVDLVERQLTGSSQSELNRYKQKLPFQVLLRMRGELLKPIISFDIQLPNQYASQWQIVDTKLQQVRSDESELNKQVFALLLLGRFVDENPLSNGGAGGNAAEAYVRSSASRILTDQLNKLTENLVSGVDLNFGLNSGEDYSTGQLAQRTDLTVGVSKRLLNDRLRVNVGSNFQVEGPRSSNQQASQLAGDVSVDYQLTKDGRYAVRAYRRNQYDYVVIGQVIETGATFVYTIDYNNFKELFTKPEDPERRRRGNRTRNPRTTPDPETP